MGALVVPPLHPLECREFDLLDGPPGSAVADEFGLVEFIDCFGGRRVRPETIPVLISEPNCRSGAVGSFKKHARSLENLVRFVRSAGGVRWSV